MIALLRQGDARQQELEREGFARLEREYTYLNDKHDLRVVISDYADVPPEISLDYVPTSSHFIDVEVTDDRPGGFDAYALAFYDRLVAALKGSYGASVRIVELPPPTNAAEYRRITTDNAIGGILLVVLGVRSAVPRYRLGDPLRITKAQDPEESQAGHLYDDQHMARCARALPSCFHHCHPACERLCVPVDIDRLLLLRPVVYESIVCYEVRALRNYLVVSVQDRRPS
jgi:hypothetical protein